MAGELQGPPAEPAKGPNLVLWGAVAFALWYLFLRKKT